MSANSGSLKTDIGVYVGILILAGVQIFMAYHSESTPILRMLAVAAVQAFLAVMYFMHLKSEKSTLGLALIPVTLFVLVMMNMIWADSYRLMHLRPFPK
jgi:heme/copper-type cytochrome/quinol oxidase subunit 4